MTNYCRASWYPFIIPSRQKVEAQVLGHLIYIGSLRLAWSQNKIKTALLVKSESQSRWWEWSFPKQGKFSPLKDLKSFLPNPEGIQNEMCFLHLTGADREPVYLISFLHTNADSCSVGSNWLGKVILPSGPLCSTLPLARKTFHQNSCLHANSAEKLSLQSEHSWTCMPLSSLGWFK